MPSDRSVVPVDVVDIALRVASALESVGAAYFVGGSVASSLQGEPRATNDIDIVVSLPGRSVPAFAAALGDDFEVDQEMLRDALHRSSCANIFYLPWVTKIDLFGVGPTAFDESEFGRRARVRVRETGEELFLKSPEDTVLRKLLWFREGGEISEKQWRDIVEVLKVSGLQLNLAYLDSWARRLAIEPLLARARGDAATQLQ